MAPQVALGGSSASSMALTSVAALGRPLPLEPRRRLLAPPAADLPPFGGEAAPR